MISNGRQKADISEDISTSEQLQSNQEFFAFEKFNWLIHLQHVRGETNSCKDLIKKEIQRSNGKNEFALFKQGEILREEGKLQEALDSFQSCLKLNSDNSDNLKEAAKCLYDMRRYKLSMEAYLEAERISKSPDWQIYYYLGQCLTKLRDDAKAKEYAHKAVKIAKHEMCYSLLVKILISEGDLKSAVAVSNAAVESCPDSVQTLTESGLLFLKMGQIQYAFERLSSALALEPTYPKALLGIGCITQKHKEYDVALTKYKIAIHFEPESCALWSNIGMCFYSKQKYIAAISCLKRALWVQPLNWRTLFNLGLTHLATSQPASAFNFACAAVNLRPDVADNFVLLGATLIELNDPSNAVRALCQAAALSPSNPVILVNTSLCCREAGQYPEAIEYLKKFDQIVETNESSVNLVQEVLDLAAALKKEFEDYEQGKLSQDMGAALPSGEISSIENSQTINEDTRNMNEELLSKDVVEPELDSDEV